MCGVAIMRCEGGRIEALYKANLLLQRTHSKRLLPMVDEAMSSSGVLPEHITAIAVSSGPGSFTGIRIGLSTAKGLAMAWEVPILPVSTLQVIALNAPAGTIVCPVLDARRNTYYSAMYERVQGGIPREVWGAGAYSSLEIAEKIRASTLHRSMAPEVVLTGDGAENVAQDVSSVLGYRVVLLPDAGLPLAENLGFIAYHKLLANDIASVEGALPTYIRRSEAEEKTERSLGGDRCN